MNLFSFLKETFISEISIEVINPNKTRLASQKLDGVRTSSFCFLRYSNTDSLLIVFIFEGF